MNTAQPIPHVSPERQLLLPWFGWGTGAGGRGAGRSANKREVGDEDHLFLMLDMSLLMTER